MILMVPAVELGETIHTAQVKTATKTVMYC